MKLSAQGRLNHHFWGDYHAGLVLAFDTPEDMRLALPKLASVGLPKQWVPGEKAPHAAFITVNSDELAMLKKHLGTLGADVDAIDSCAHSVDYGDPFSITVEVEDPRQLSFPFYC